MSQDRTGKPDEDSTSRVAIVVPCYRVRDRVADVVRKSLDHADLVVCVDDACPDGSGDLIEAEFGADARVRLVRLERNGGVGAAMVAGYREALDAGSEILVKVDGDGQIDPRLIPQLVRPIQAGEADYVKGNRFFSVDTVASMPLVRVLGNAGLSFFSKLSTGYWNLFDPNNGLTAIEANVARQVPLDRLHPRFFFESDLLFRLGVLRARVVELPMVACYGDEESNLDPVHALLTFPFLHLRNFAKRVFYNYFLRNFSLASLNLVAGLFLLGFGASFGAIQWAGSISTGFASTAGTVMLAGLPVILGIQLLLSFLSHDISMTPDRAIHPRLRSMMTLAPAGEGLHGSPTP